jgi:predicted RecA/RadA family phage recombinase
MKTFLQSGKRIDVVAPSGGLTAGQFYVLGVLFGVIENTVLEGETTVLVTEDVFTLPKTTGTAWVQGDQLYWDVSTSKFTKTAGENISYGAAAAAAASGDTTGAVRLGIGGAEAGPIAQQAAITDLAGTLTGTTDGTMVDVGATAAATAGGSTPSAAQVDAGIATAVASIVTGVNLQNKELMVKLNDILAKLRLAGVIEDA